MLKSTDVESRVVQLLETDRIVEDLSAVLGRDEASVRSMLAEEAGAPGQTVAKELQSRGIEPHVFSQALEEFYGQSDAFVFELVIWNRNKQKAAMLRWTGEQLDKEATKLGRPLRVLTFGDGIGVDSAGLTLRGHDVTYFDFPGYTQRIAERLFAKLNITPKVVTKFDELPANGFDVITCFDVLEHVPKPRELLASVVNLLADDGVLYVHSPFYLILPEYATHLRENRKFSGRLGLYERAGLKLIGGRAMWNPLMFGRETSARKGTAAKRLLLRIVGLGLQTGRHTSVHFRPLHKLIRG